MDIKHIAENIPLTSNACIVMNNGTIQNLGAPSAYTDALRKCDVNSPSLYTCFYPLGIPQETPLGYLATKCFTGANFNACTTVKFPANFSSLCSYDILVVTDCTQSGCMQHISTYGTAGEPYNQHTTTTITTCVDYVANQLTYIPVADALPNVAANDIVGVRIRNGVTCLAGNWYFIGIRLRYIST